MTVEGQIFIVGGGASLRGFDWSRLNGKFVIAVNRAFEVLPKAQIVYYSDNRMWREFKDKLKSHHGEKVTGDPLVPETDATKVKFSGSAGLDRRKGHIRHGNDSGYAAINLAVHYEPMEIILLGFDMMVTDGRAHWHNGYATDSRPYSRQALVFKKMLPFYSTICGPLADLGVKVYNTSLNSMIGVFPKCSIDTLL